VAARCRSVGTGKLAVNLWLALIRSRAGPPAVSTGAGVHGAHRERIVATAMRDTQAWSDVRRTQWEQNATADRLAATSCQHCDEFAVAIRRVGNPRAHQSPSRTMRDIWSMH